MKRYLVFCWDQYYPSGGFNDFMASFDSLDEAEEWLLTSRWQAQQLVDTANGHSWRLK